MKTVVDQQYLKCGILKEFSWGLLCSLNKAKNNQIPAEEEEISIRTT
jgi:hypothetical protein